MCELTNYLMGNCKSMSTSDSVALHTLSWRKWLVVRAVRAPLSVWLALSRCAWLQRLVPKFSLVCSVSWGKCRISTLKWGTTLLLPNDGPLSVCTTFDGGHQPSIVMRCNKDIMNAYVNVVIRGPCTFIFLPKRALQLICIHFYEILPQAR